MYIDGKKTRVLSPEDGGARRSRGAAPHTPPPGPGSQGRRSTATEPPAGRGWAFPPTPCLPPGGRPLSPPHTPSPQAVGQRKESAPTQLQLRGGGAAAFGPAGRQGCGLPQWPPPWRSPPAPPPSDGPLQPPALSLLLRAEPAGRERDRGALSGGGGRSRPAAGLKAVLRLTEPPEGPRTRRRLPAVLQFHCLKRYFSRK